MQSRKAVWSVWSVVLVALTAVIVTAQDEEEGMKRYVEIQEEASRLGRSVPVVFYRGREDQPAVRKFAAVLKENGWDLIGLHNVNASYSNKERFHKAWGADQFEPPFVRVLVYAENGQRISPGIFDLKTVRSREQTLSEWKAYWEENSTKGNASVTSVARVAQPTIPLTPLATPQVSLDSLTQEFKKVDKLQKGLGQVLTSIEADLTAYESQSSELDTFGGIRAQLDTLEKLKKQTANTGEILGGVKGLQTVITSLLEQLNEIQADLITVQKRAEENSRFVEEKTKELLTSIQAELSSVDTPNFQVSPQPTVIPASDNQAPMPGEEEEDPGRIKFKIEE